ncbi:hypothetical protein SXCC_03356 [Gluconacetobacter sp. SXCC-1]|nr:hypothetical protein SXCC_03356 [Gluconacetobacter sp. SXCC-1]
MQGTKFRHGMDRSIISKGNALESSNATGWRARQAASR